MNQEDASKPAGTWSWRGTAESNEMGSGIDWRGLEEVRTAKQAVV